MIQRGSNDESEARRHIAAWLGLMRHWNHEADTFRRAARGIAATPDLLAEAERMQFDLRQAAEFADLLDDNLAPGHELRSELMRVNSGMEALRESVDVSIEGIEARLEVATEVARLRFLVSALRQELRQDQTLAG